MSDQEIKGQYYISKAPKGIDRIRDFMEQAKIAAKLRLRRYQEDSVARSPHPKGERLKDLSEEDRVKRLTEVITNLQALLEQVTFHPDSNLPNGGEAVSQKSKRRDSWGKLSYFNRLLQQPATGIAQLLSDLTQPDAKELLKTGNTEVSNLISKALTNLVSIYARTADNMQSAEMELGGPIRFRWDTISNPLLDQNSLHAELFSKYTVEFLTGILENSPADSTLRDLAAACFKHFATLLPTFNVQEVIIGKTQGVIKEIIGNEPPKTRGDDSVVQLLWQAISSAKMYPVFKDHIRYVLGVKEDDTGPRDGYVTLDEPEEN